MPVQRFCGFVVTDFQLGSFGVGHYIGSVLKERDGCTAALMDDLHSAGLRVDLAYLFGVAVLNADHVYLLCFRVCVDHIPPV